MSTPVTRAAIYNRISHDKNADEAAVTRQNDAAVKLAAERGWEVVGTYVDNSISASRRDVVRPAYERMLADHRTGRFSVIIAQDLDRLTRQPRQLEDWIDEAERGELRIVTLDGEADLGTDGGRMYARIKAAVARGEVERKGARQKFANEARSRAGAWSFSRRPYGYERRDGRVRIVQDEAAVLREAYARVNRGESLYAVGEDFNARGIRALGGGTWTPRQLARTLDNPHNAGIVTYRGERVPGATPQWDPIIDQRTWDTFVSARQEKNRPSGWSSAHKHLMSGLLVCGVCGARMLARPERGVLVYSCKDGWCVSITAEDVDPVVRGMVIARLQNPAVLAELRSRPDTAPIEKELREARSSLADMTDLLAEGLLDRERAREQGRTLTERIARLEQRLAAARAESPLADLALADQVAPLWDSKTVVEQRRIITELGLQITVRKGKPGRRPRDAQGRRIPDLTRLRERWIHHEDNDSATEPVPAAEAATP